MSQLSKWLQTPSGLFFRQDDERIYALIRIVFAAVALLNLLCLWPDRHVLFSDGGMIDQQVAISQAQPVYLSVFAFAHSDTAVTAVMLLTALALLMLLAGIGARAAALWVFVWHVSYIARAPLALAGWDNILRAFSFLILVSPLGKCWTLPIGQARTSPPAYVSSHGLVLMRLQVVVIYWQAVLARFRHPESYWTNGEFLSYFMLSHHSRWPGPWVLKYPDLMALGTYCVLLGEIAIPILLWVRKTRWWGILLGVTLHAGICVLADNLGLFCLSMLMTYLAFLRSEDVEKLGHWLPWRKSEPGK